MRVRTIGLLALVGVSVAACAGGGSDGGRAPAAKHAAASGESLPQLPPPGARDNYAPAGGEGAQPPAFAAVDGPDAALTPIDKALHERAREAARSGRLHEAKRLLGHLAFSYPEHEVLIAQYNAVGAKIDGAQAGAKAGLEAIVLRTPAAPPPVYTLARRAVLPDAAIPKIVKRSQTKNQITDNEAWFQKNDLRTREYFVETPGDMLWAPGILSTKIVADLKGSFVYVEHEVSHRFKEETLPLEVPPAYGSLRLTHAIDAAPYLVAIYGDRVVAVLDAAKKVTALFDLVNFRLPPADKAGKAVVGSASLTTSEGTKRADITVDTHSVVLDLLYAFAADGVLYVEHAMNGYTKEAKGQTGYITALDLATGDMLWRSAPLVARSYNFAVVEGGIVCGFGFTAEPRFMHVLDRATGATVQTVQTSTTPDEIIPKGNAIYVRGYDSDFIFDVKLAR
ncbi:hypothetical protein AKJ09_03162 [Labilithrix luteola]|uniref:Lipoprotein n=1 Tax=Labilithrix luteola TaxID=1391654 RepID=A0A0K1PSI4_9BACT|nr:hypothetical protein [Labilithrix luteola]AKU96498.1 hypothetical protein AKJ09_03162 [Labilithrix luteola]